MKHKCQQRKYIYGNLSNMNLRRRWPRCIDGDYVEKQYNMFNESYNSQNITNKIPY